MENISLATIRDRYEFASSICDRLPEDSVVLFYGAGRDYEKIVAQLNSLENKTPDHSDIHYSNQGLQKLKRIFFVRNQLFEDFATSALEITGNASLYGLDAFFMSDNREVGRPESHVSVAVAFSRKTNKLFLLVQNYASPRAAREVIRRARMAHRKLKTKSNLDHSTEPTERFANPKDQPLLQMAGPVNSAANTMDWLLKRYRHDSGRLGIQHATKYANAPLMVDHIKAEFKSFDSATDPETEAALKQAIAEAKLKPEQVRSLTVVVPFSIGPVDPS